MSLSSDKLPIGFLTVQSRQAATLGGGRQVGNQTKNYRAKAHGLGHALCVHQFHMSTRTCTSVLKSQEKTLTIQRRSPGFRELMPLVCLLNLSAPLTSCLCLAGGKECEVQRRWGTAADRPSHLCTAVALPPSHAASSEGPQKIHSLEMCLLRLSATAALAGLCTLSLQFYIPVGPVHLKLCRFAQQLSFRHSRNPASFETNKQDPVQSLGKLKQRIAEGPGDQSPLKSKDLVVGHSRHL